MADAVNPFAGRRTRVLGLPDVRRLLSMVDTIEIQRRAFIALARGETVAAPNSWVRLPGERRGWMKVLAGYEGSSSALGIKVLARFPENPPGANLGSLVLLFDADNGFPLAIMDGVYLTALRTGAGAALATEVLARPDARSIAVVGTGVVAWHSLAAICECCPRLATVTVHSRSEPRRREFAGRVERELGVTATPAEHVEHAVAGADVIVTATNSPGPILFERYLQPGQHVNAMGIKTEIDPEAIRMCRVIGDGREETIADGKFSVALDAGAVAESDLGPDLGAVLAGLAPGRVEDRQITLFDSSGVAAQDLACARAVWERAERQDVGVVVDLAPGEVLAASTEAVRQR